VFVDDRRQAERPRDLDGPIAAAVIDEDNLVYALARNVADRRLERRLGIVRGQDDDALLERPPRLPDPLDKLLNPRAITSSRINVSTF
jgi:hypothetical protein